MGEWRRSRIWHRSKSRIRVRIGSRIKSRIRRIILKIFFSIIRIRVTNKIREEIISVDQEQEILVNV